MSSTEGSESRRRFAAVDLGSNSFHVIIAEVGPSGKWQPHRLIKRPVQLARGLSRDRRLTLEAQDRALRCLRDFREELQDIPGHRIVAVGTDTLRQLEDGGSFMELSSQALGVPVSVISGYEEARLIFQGVGELRAREERRLICDIGGGSTEIVYGSSLPSQMTSLRCGCISWSQRYFPDGGITPERVRRAIWSARILLQPWLEAFQSAQRDVCLGTSGTIKSTARVLRNMGYAAITPASLQALMDQMTRLGHVTELELEGLKPQRRSVFPGGVAILMAVMEGLSISSLEFCPAALREGLLVEVLKRSRGENIQEATIAHLRQRFGLDEEQGERRRRQLSLLLESLPPWSLPPRELEQLGWAMELSGIGRRISSRGFKRHGAYILQNLHMPGFTREEQNLLSFLIRFQKGALPQLRDLEPLRGVQISQLLRMLMLMRVLLGVERLGLSVSLTGELQSTRVLGITTSRPLQHEEPIFESFLAEESERWDRASLGLRLTGSTPFSADWTGPIPV